jgi:hypothetical protein
MRKYGLECPARRGQPAQEDRQGHPVERRVLQQAQPPVRRRKARREPAHGHQLHPLRPAFGEAVLPLGPEGRVHQRDRRVDPIGVARRRVRDRHAPEARLRKMAPGRGSHPLGPGVPLHLVRLRQVPLGRRHRPVDVAEGKLLGQRADGVLLRARQGRAFAPPMLGFRGRPRGDVLVHRLLQQRPPADGARQDDARGIPRLPPRQASQAARSHKRKGLLPAGSNPIVPRGFFLMCP